MKKKVIALFLAALLLVTMMVGCAKSETAEPSVETSVAEEPASNDPVKIRVGFEWHEYQSAINDAWTDYLEQYTAEYAPEAGVEIEWINVYGDGTPTTEAANIEALINQEVDVICCWCNDGDAIGPSIKAANDAGIPFIAFDHATTEPATSFVGSDSYAQGYDLGNYYAEMLKEDGLSGMKVIEMMGSLTDQNSINRSESFAKANEENGNLWEVVVQVPTDWEAEKFKSGLANALVANPDVDCIFLASDFAFSSVAAALEEADMYYPIGDERHITILSCDMQPQAYQPMLDGYIDVSSTYDCWYHATTLVELICDYANGGEIPSESLVGCRIVTPETLAETENLWARDYKD